MKKVYIVVEPLSLTGDFKLGVCIEVFANKKLAKAFVSERPYTRQLAPASIRTSLTFKREI